MQPPGDCLSTGTGRFFYYNKKEEVCEYIYSHTPTFIIEQKDIALNHENPSIENPSIISYDDKEMNNVDSLESNAINSACSEAACAIGQLLWDSVELFDFFY